MRLPSGSVQHNSLTADSYKIKAAPLSDGIPASKDRPCKIFIPSVEKRSSSEKTSCNSTCFISSFPSCSTKYQSFQYPPLIKNEQFETCVTPVICLISCLKVCMFFTVKFHGMLSINKFFLSNPSSLLWMKLICLPTITAQVMHIAEMLNWANNKILLSVELYPLHLVFTF